MFSSSKFLRPSAFAVVVACIFASCLALVLITAAVVDPFGMLGKARLLPDFCSEGIKSGNGRAVLPMLLSVRQEATVLIGTSRVISGFSQDDWATAGRNEAINIALPGMAMEEAYQILYPALESGRVSELWLGLDYGMFRMRYEGRHKLTLPRYRVDGRWSPYRYGLFNMDALREAVLLLIFKRSCSVVLRRANGFISSAATGYDLLTTIDLSSHRALTAAAFLASPTDAERVYDDQMQLLRQLLAIGLANSVKLRVWVNPSPPAYFEVIADAGVLPQYQRWLMQLQEMIAGHSTTNLRFADLSSWYSSPDFTADPWQSEDFYDVTHYKPHVGRRIIETLSSSKSISEDR